MSSDPDTTGEGDAVSLMPRLPSSSTGAALSAAVLDFDSVGAVVGASVSPSHMVDASVVHEM